MTSFSQTTRGRTRTSTLVLIAVFAGLVALWLLIGAHPVILGFLALFALPALWEWITDPQGYLRFDTHGLSWGWNGNEESLPLSRIDRVRFDTRLDLSVRTTLILTDGKRFRLSHAIEPRDTQRFEAALREAGVTTERHHFSLRS